MSGEGISAFGRIGTGVAALSARVALIPGAARALWRTALEQGPRQRAMESTLLTMLGSRHAALVSSSRKTAAAAVADAFAERSASYRRSLNEGAARVQSVHAEVARSSGIVWWIPGDARRVGGLASRVREQWLPVREMLQTRRFAVGGIMLDIGANIGTTAIPRVILGDVERVYAAEPDPANYACLVQNVLENQLAGFVLPDRVAIGDRDGDALFSRASQIGNHRLLRDDVKAPRKAIAVPCLTLDSWVDGLGIELDLVSFIKSDTQGWERRVLAGADRVLSHRHIVWEIEFSPTLLEQSGDSATELVNQIRRSFTHFVDLRRAATRICDTTRLAAEMSALGRPGRPRYTNLLLFNVT